MKTLLELKRDALEAALKKHNGNRTYTARELGISLRTVRVWIHKFGLPMGPPPVVDSRAKTVRERMNK